MAKFFAFPTSEDNITALILQLFHQKCLHWSTELCCFAGFAALLHQQIIYPSREPFLVYGVCYAYRAVLVV
jgi:hypothetical protein